MEQRKAGTGEKMGAHVLMTKGLAVEGSAVLADDFTGARRARSYRDAPCATRGSLLETRLKIGQLSQAGLEVDSARLPVTPIAARFADVLQFDPLRTVSSAALAVTIPVEQLAAASEAPGEP